MSMRSWQLTSAAVLLLATVAFHLKGFLIAAVILAVPYLILLRFFPRTRHQACNGTGEVRSRIFPWSFHRCRGCSAGRMVRYGARVFGADHVRNEHKRAVAARKTMRQNGSWR
jgi:hypothetical protein